MPAADKRNNIWTRFFGNATQPRTLDELNARHADVVQRRDFAAAEERALRETVEFLRSEMAIDGSLDHQADGDAKLGRADELKQQIADLDLAVRGLTRRRDELATRTASDAAQAAREAHVDAVVLAGKQAMNAAAKIRDAFETIGLRYPELRSALLALRSLEPGAVALLPAMEGTVLRDTLATAFSIAIGAAGGSQLTAQELTQRADLVAKVRDVARMAEEAAAARGTGIKEAA